MNKSAPIAIFDSGVGGLSVFKEIEALMPNENLIYFGDTARVPYGTRSAATIQKFVKSDLDFLARFSPKLVVVACGTASCVGAPVLEQECEHFTSVISPSAIAAAKTTKSGRIGVISTAATLKSGAFEKKIKELLPQAQVFTQAAQMFVNVVENGWIEEDNEIANAVAKEYLKDLKQRDIDTLILGCTHFPLLSAVIQKQMGEGVTLISSGYETALAAKMDLEALGLRNESDTVGSRKCFVSDNKDSFCALTGIFLGHEVPKEHVELVEVN
ncbi:MAG: glutamate racemase [Clostridia bacterium]|nr:glutamate racemase [Clostridia bacterium]